MFYLEHYKNNLKWDKNESLPAKSGVDTVKSERIFGQIQWNSLFIVEDWFLSLPTTQGMVLRLSAEPQRQQGGGTGIALSQGFVLEVAGRRRSGNCSSMKCWTWTSSWRPTSYRSSVVHHTAVVLITCLIQDAWILAEWLESRIRSGLYGSIWQNRFSEWVDFRCKFRSVNFNTEVAEFSLRCSRILPEIDQHLTDVPQVVELHQLLFGMY